MRIEWINRQQKNLIVYFAGWGTPASAVAHLSLPADYDLLICYDYQDLSLDFDFSLYQHIRVVAWSMGVWVADQVLSQRSIQLLSATAINGTGAPCDDQFGIPTQIFLGTLQQLDSANLVKFQRRMCGDKATFAAYQQLEGQRTAVQNQQELNALYQAIQQRTPAKIAWSKVIIGEQDRIFPSQNQQHYWLQYFQQQSGKICLEKLPHFPFAAFEHWLQLC